VQAAAGFAPPWLVLENYAFMPALARLRRWLDDGRLGEVRLVEVRQVAWMDRGNPYFNTAWRAQPRYIGGFVVDGGVHLAHVVRRLLGMPVRVRSLTASFDPALPPIDTAVAVLEFASGALGTWTSCFTARGEAPLLRILGSAANAELHRDRAVLTTAAGRETVVPSTVDSYEAQFRHFAAVVLRGVAPLVTPAEALADLTLIAAICGSGGPGCSRTTSGPRRRQ
jgi:predicted dehydrogenase